MKLTRLTTLAIAAAALAGTLGAQQRGGNYGGNNRSAPRAQAPQRAQAPRAQAPRNYAENRSRPESRPMQQYARPESRPMQQYGRPDSRPSQYARSRPDVRGHTDFRGDDRRGIPVADHGRPLITRGGFAGREGFNGGVRYGAGFNRWGGRLVLPYGWESRLYVRGYFPVAYSTYCEPVPPDYDYMLPDMLPNYDSCLFGDRIVVMDRFSRGIVFTAILR
ncbi:MAG TPA: hypothetical protein VGQ30_03275 [Gemmatimonadaceae bacterium]|nr:hypothetical protein [Gemmatimonadaceae bacterium]